MLRAVVMAARLGFSIDPPIDAAIATHRHDIARSAPARLIEEIYKVLRAGAAERAFRMLAERRLLEPIAAQLQKGCGDSMWESLAALDAYRARFEATPASLTNAILLGSVLVPLGLGAMTPPPPRGQRQKEPAPSLGMLPLARRDVERLHHVLMMQRRLLDVSLSPRGKHALMHRGPFQEALTWMEIHGGAPEALEHWRGFIEAAASLRPGDEIAQPRPRKRRRRRGRRRPSSAGPRRIS
jgi:poly(A) polymerase